MQLIGFVQKDLILHLVQKVVESEEEWVAQILIGRCQPSAKGRSWGHRGKSIRFYKGLAIFLLWWKCQ
jgi:hypothetical protein